MTEASRIRAQVQGDRVQVRLLMAHDMENGFRKDAAGKVLPAWFIQQVTVAHNGRTVLSAQWGPSVSKNPFLQFSFQGGKTGDRLSVSWTDNRGARRTDDALIA